MSQVSSNLTESLWNPIQAIQKNPLNYPQEEKILNPQEIKNELTGFIPSNGSIIIKAWWHEQKEETRA